MKKILITLFVLVLIGCADKVENKFDKLLHIQEVKQEISQIKADEQVLVVPHSNLLNRSMNMYTKSYIINDSFQDDITYYFPPLDQTQSIYYGIELLSKDLAGEFAGKGMYISIGYHPLFFSRASGYYSYQESLQAAEDYKIMGKLAYEDQIGLANDESVFFVPGKTCPDCNKFLLRIDPTGVHIIERWPEMIKEFEEVINTEITVTIYRLSSYKNLDGNIVDNVAFDYKHNVIHKPHRIRYVYGTGGKSDSE